MSDLLAASDTNFLPKQSPLLASRTLLFASFPLISLAALSQSSLLALSPWSWALCSFHCVFSLSHPRHSYAFEYHLHTNNSSNFFSQDSFSERQSCVFITTYLHSVFKTNMSKVEYLSPCLISKYCAYLFHISKMRFTLFFLSLKNCF